jgi:hypothetical protein
MTLFKVVTQKGKRYLETQTGEMLPIEGDKIARDAKALAVYRDAQANYWFINKNGQPTQIPPEKVQWAVNTIMAERQVKEAGLPVGSVPPAATQAPVQQTTIVESPNNGGNGAAAMVGTGAMAMGGAMMGSMLGAAITDTNHWYGVPYGAPIYREGARGYYNNNGNRVYVNNAHNTDLFRQYNAQGAWDHRENWGADHHAFGGGWGGFRGRR